MGPTPVVIFRSGRWPLRTTWRWPCSSVSGTWPRSTRPLPPRWPREHPLGALGESRSIRRSGWKRNARCVLPHGGVLLGKIVFEANKFNPSTPPSSTPHPQHWLYLINVMRNASCCCKPAEARPLAGKSCISLSNRSFSARRHGR